MENRLEFTVVLPVYHGGRFLRDALSSLRQIDFPPERFEVFVVGTDDDGESRNRVRVESGRSAFKITYIGCPESKRSRKLNVACMMARGRVLAFADDDCIFHRNWLKKLSEVFKGESDIGIVGGQDEFEPGGSAFDLALDSVLNSFLGTGGLRRGAGPRAGKYYPKLWNMAVPRDVALKGPLRIEERVPQVFNESLTVHEDVDLANRIVRSGKRIVFAPEVRIGHRRDTTFRSFISSNFAMARISRSLGVHRLPHAVLAAFALGTSALVLASFFLYPLRIVLLILLTMYITTLLASAIAGFKRSRSLKVLAIIPWLLVFLHFARGLGYLFPWRNRNTEVRL